MTKFYLKKRNFYPWIFAGLVLFTYLLGYQLTPSLSRLNLDFFLSATSTIGAFCYFLYSQYNKNTDIFIRLFNEFNLRYNTLNNGLNELFIKDINIPFSDKDKNLLFDYFNLCAEEYLFFKSGYIDNEVWLSWLKGMKYFTSNNQVRELWRGELMLGSYYGFSLEIIDNV